MNFAIVRIPELQFAPARPGYQTPALAVAILLLMTASMAMGQNEFKGDWNCVLESPGGDLRFGLKVDTSSNHSLAASISNGDEQIEVPVTAIDDGKLSLQFTHYDSQIVCTSDGGQLTGTWRKRRGLSEWLEMNFRATPVDANQQIHNRENALPFAGRWSVDFLDSADPAVAEFKANQDGSIAGTFLTTTGDYRYLAGRAIDDKMELSCFDGAHAFLFRASLKDGEKLVGDFWSSNNWHEKWTAVRNPKAELPDAFAQTRRVNEEKIGACSFPDLNGTPTRLDDPKFAADVIMIYVFGSWCPNCHDAADYFSELKNEYSDDQLSIVGLAFELTGDFDRDAEQVKRYLSRHGVDYPCLIAGTSDKSQATRAIPFLDRVRSYPTTIFLDSKLRVKAIHTGFSGPATGKAFEELKSEFKTLIESMINEAR